MDRYARIVFGFHGTDPAFAERLIRGEASPADWAPSAHVIVVPSFDHRK